MANGLARDVATEPTKLEQINRSQAYQFLPEFFFSIAYILKPKQLRPGFEPQTIGCKGDGVTSRPSGKGPGNC